ARLRPERDRQALDVARGHRPVEASAERLGEHDVIGDREIPVERRGLGHVADPLDRLLPVLLGIDPARHEASFGRPLEADPAPDQRRLARSVRADEGGDRALGNRQVDMAQRPRSPAIALAEPMGLEDRRHPSLPIGGLPDRSGGATNPRRSPSRKRAGARSPDRAPAVRVVPPSSSGGRRRTASRYSPGSRCGTTRNDRRDGSGTVPAMPTKPWRDGIAVAIALVAFGLGLLPLTVFHYQPGITLG